MTRSFLHFIAFVAIGFASFSNRASALDLDWHGQFRAETNTIFGYSHGKYWAAGGDQGYFVPNAGESPAMFQNLFFRVNPDVIVNDNVTILTEWWLGTPDRGAFGTGTSTGSESRQFFSSDAGTTSIAARHFYVEAASDFGVVTIGRAPLNWGLGLVWNSNKAKKGVDNAFDRFPSTGDTIALTTKIGSFKFTPRFVKYRSGSNVTGGNSTSDISTGGSTANGSSNASDYSFALTYENPDDRMEMGVMFLRRLAGRSQNAGGIADPTSNAAGNAGYTYNIWDFVAKKGLGIFDFAAEVPLTSGRIAGVEYSAFAFAGEAKAQINDHWDFVLKAGQAPGQGNITTPTPGKFTAFSFHPDYRPGFLMFNYNYRNFSESASGNSPYDNPIVNARYLALGGGYSINKWSFRLNGMYATALETAAAGTNYWNSQTRNFAAATVNQSAAMGMEFDTNVGYQWDESLRLSLMSGLYFPGAFFEFNNTATPNEVKTVFGTALQLSVVF